MFCAETRLKSLSKWQKIICSLTNPENTNRIVSKQAYKEICRGIVNEIKVDIVNSTKTVSSQLLSLMDDTKIQPLSLRKLFEEIDAITKEYGEDNVEFRNGKLTVNIGNVTLTDHEEDVDLGRFTIQIHLSSPLPLDKIEVSSRDDICSESGYIHPHISGVQLCMGDGEEPAYEAICSGRLHDFFLILESTLKTYNPESPYKELSDWYNPNHDGECFCDFCERWVPDDVIVCCDKCDTVCCDECAEGIMCRDCGNWTCSNCTVQCTECLDEICPNCNETCSDCSEPCCDACAATCETCDSIICLTCASNCSECGGVVCKTCSYLCSTCGQVLCDKCQTECEDCGAGMCENCVNKCTECSNNICHKCSEHCCEECGRQMCKDCFEQDSGCLLKETTIE